MISSAILGVDCETVMVAGKVYVIHPPTIERRAGAMLHLSSLEASGKDTMADVMAGMKDIGEAAKGLSWFIAGDESLSAELSRGTVDEVVLGLVKSLNMVSAQNFTMLSALVRNVLRLIARPKL